MKEFKPLVLFLLRFLGTYVGLTWLYYIYLNRYLPFGQADPFTKFTAKATKWGLNATGTPTSTMEVPREEFVRILIDGEYISFVNEGCNAISIVIIFIAFIVAFYTNIKQTLGYIIAGLVLIFIMNVSRIMLLSYIFKYMPDYGKIGHDYLFPAILYGTIVALWLVWIKYFVIPYKKEHAENH